MTNQRVGIGLLALVAYSLLYPSPNDPCKDGKCPAPPLVAPVPEPPRRPSPSPWDDQAGPVGSPVEGGKVSPDGKVEVACDLPETEKKHNVGGRDGAGLCVFTSIEYSARWQNERALFNFQKQMRQELGGGYPSKVDAMIKKYAPNVKYIQHTGKDYELLKAAIKSGRMPAVTYDGHDVHYRGSIAHMVSLAHADDQWAAITDNNYPKDSQHVWMTPSDFKQRWDGWAVFLISPPPPPPPRNL